MNKVILVGRLTQDPQVNYTDKGKAVASFTIAVRRYLGARNNDKDATDYIPVVAWEKLGEICGKNLTKGQKILVEGRLQIRSYESNDGQKRRIAEVIARNIEFLGRKYDNAGNDAKSATNVNLYFEKR